MRILASGGERFQTFVGVHQIRNRVAQTALVVLGELRQNPVCLIATAPLASSQSLIPCSGRTEYSLGGHPKPAIEGHLKTGQR